MSFRGSKEVEQESKAKELQNLNCLIGVSLIFGIASGFMTSGTKYYESDKCVSLLDWTLWYFYYNIFVFVASFIFYFIKKYDHSGQNSERRLCIKSTYSVFLAFCGLAFCVILVGYCYSFDLGEPCGQLRKFVLATIIITLVSLFLYVGMMFCACLFGLWTLFMSRRKQNIDGKNTELHLKEETI